MILESDNSIKIDQKLQVFLDPPFVYIPKEGEYPKYVFMGQSIGDDISSVSGKVVREEFCLVGSRKENCLVVENDYREKRKDISCKKKYVRKEDVSDIFKSSRYLIINAINDEVYVINQVVELKLRINEILEFLDEVARMFAIPKVIIAVKANDCEIIEECLEVIGTYPNINISLLEDKYLLGRKEFLLKELKICEDEAMCFGVTEFLKIIDKVKYGRDLLTRVITVSGDALKIGCVFQIKKNIILKDLLDKIRDLMMPPYVLIAGNLLNGNVINESLILTDEVVSIHVMKKKEFKTKKCINCGACVNICPVGVNPHKCMVKKTHDEKCIKCGLCSYVCPSFIPLRNLVVSDED